MQKTLSPRHRDLAHVSPRIHQSVTLQGKMSKRSPSSEPQARTWGVLAQAIERRINSPSREQRFLESARSHRTLQPQYNTEQESIRNKRMFQQANQPKNPGNWINVYQRTSTIEQINKLGKRTFKEKNASPERPMSPTRTYFKTHPRKYEDFSSQINGLPCTTQREEPFVNIYSPRGKKLVKSPSNQRLNSNQVLDTKARPSSVAGSRQMPQHMTSTFMIQPSFNSPSQKKYHNRESYETFYDDNRVSHLSRGRSPISRENSRMSNTTDTIERLNHLTKGKKVTIQRETSPIVLDNDPCEERMSLGKGRAMYSYRTFASQVPL